MEHEHNGCVGHPVTNLLMGAQAGAAEVINFGAARAAKEAAGGAGGLNFDELPADFQTMVADTAALAMKMSAEWDEQTARSKRIEEKLDRLLAGLGEPIDKPAETTAA